MVARVVKILLQMMILMRMRMITRMKIIIIMKMKMMIMMLPISSNSSSGKCPRGWAPTLVFNWGDKPRPFLGMRMKLMLVMMLWWGWDRNELNGADKACLASKRDGREANIDIDFDIKIDIDIDIGIDIDIDGKDKVGHLTCIKAGWQGRKYWYLYWHGNWHWYWYRYWWKGSGWSPVLHQSGMAGMQARKKIGSPTYVEAKRRKNWDFNIFYKLSKSP